MQNPSTNPFPRMHTSLYVTDIQKTVAFYSSFFGVEPVKVKADYAKFILEEPSLIISFVENPEKAQPAFGHLGFQVENEEVLFSYLERAQLAKLPILEEMNVACCYAIQDKFWVSDPDGIQWEIYVFKEDAEFNDPRYANQEAQACCMPKSQMKLELVAAEKEEQCCATGSNCC